jgi:hypothetical protein
MGVLYKVEDVLLGRLVGLKFLADGLLKDWLAPMAPIRVYCMRKRGRGRCGI